MVVVQYFIYCHLLQLKVNIVLRPLRYFKLMKYKWKSSDRTNELCMEEAERNPAQCLYERFSLTTFQVVNPLKFSKRALAVFKNYNVNRKFEIISNCITVPVMSCFSKTFNIFWVKMLSESID